jgi:hypothetical protein
MKEAAAAYSRSLEILHMTGSYETIGGLKLLVERAQYEWHQKAYKCSMETFQEALRIHAKTAGKEWVSPRKTLIVESIVQLKAAQDALHKGGSCRYPSRAPPTKAKTAMDCARLLRTPTKPF